MKLEVLKGDLLDAKSDAAVIGLFKEAKLEREIERIDELLNFEISEAIKNKKFLGETGQIYAISTLGKLPYKKLFLLGLGEKLKFDLEVLRRASATVALAVRNSNASEFVSNLHNIKGLHIGNEGLLKASAEAFVMALYQFMEFKTQELDKIKKVEKILFLEYDNKRGEKVTKALKEVEVITECVKMARDLVNKPSSLKTPKDIARYAEHVAKTTGIKAKIYDKADMEKMGMNTILAVNRGSFEEPRLVVLDYNDTAENSIALVGKGITFDSGGLNLKPFEAMKEMKIDMAGAATVIATVAAAAILKLPQRVIGVATLTENMPGPNAAKPGDIVRSYNGKTVEIIHTDAEGRLILADALAFTEEMKPKAIIDLATLTGAVNVALGRYFIGAMGNDEKLMQKVVAAANQTGEKIWELPLTDEYMDMVKGDLGDVRNLGKYSGEAGTITAAAFLKNFVEKTPWVHLDIAAAAFLSDGDPLRQYMPKGASGVGVRLLVELIRNWQ